MCRPGESAHVRTHGRRACAPAIIYIVTYMYWPLIGGFIAFVLIAILLGWILDPDRRREDTR